MQKNLYIPLNLGSAYGILSPVKRRRSILVRSAVSEEGPKNPFKGIAVKPLVPASYAQFGVGAGWKARQNRACGRRAFPNGMGKPTLRAWRPVHVHGRTPSAARDLCTAQVRNLYCGATRPGAVNAVCRCSLPCVGMARIGDLPRSSPAREGRGIAP